MAFPDKSRMPPPKNPMLAISIGAKPKGTPPDVGGGEPDSEAGEKKSPERALVSRADENCGNCENWHEDTGECDEVDGTYAPDDRCYSDFEPKGGAEQPEGAGMGDMAGAPQRGGYGQ